MRNQKGFTLVEVSMVVIILAVIVGWIWNLVKVFQMLDCGFTPEMIIRIISIFAWPIGAIFGYIPIMTGC